MVMGPLPGMSNLIVSGARTRCQVGVEYGLAERARAAVVGVGHHKRLGIHAEGHRGDVRFRVACHVHGK